MTHRNLRSASLVVCATLLSTLGVGGASRLRAQTAPAPPAASGPSAPPPVDPPTVPVSAASGPTAVPPAAAPPAAAPRTILPAPPPTNASAPDTLTAAELDALFAPVALYPDPLLGQVLVATTYPLEIVQAHQWVAKNPKLQGDALLEAARKQSWDPSVQLLVAFPDVIKRLSENISWTTALGDAFLAQQSDVMDAVQRLRLRATQDGKLASSEQQTVTTKQVEQRTVVEIQPTSTQVVYVPVYNPTAVWGPPAYPYPMIYYPPPPAPGALLVSFGVGMAVGAAVSHGGWGYGCGWGHSNVVVVNHHNTFIRNTDVRRDIHRQGGTSNWQHDARHRGKVPYSNARVADKYGGSGRAPLPGGRPSAPRAGTFDRPSRAATADGAHGLANERRAAPGRAPGATAPRAGGSDPAPTGSVGERPRSDFDAPRGGGFGDRSSGGGGPARGGAGAGRRSGGGGGRRR